MWTKIMWKINKWKKERTNYDEHKPHCLHICNLKSAAPKCTHTHMDIN